MVSVSARRTPAASRKARAPTFGALKRPDVVPVFWLLRVAGPSETVTHGVPRGSKPRNVGTPQPCAGRVALCSGASRRVSGQRPGAQGGIEAVSYTHLRAHETGRNLVCRLL